MHITQGRMENDRFWQQYLLAAPLSWDVLPSRPRSGTAYCTDPLSAAGHTGQPTVRLFFFPLSTWPVDTAYSQFVIFLSSTTASTLYHLRQIRRLDTPPSSSPHTLAPRSPLQRSRRGEGGMRACYINHCSESEWSESWGRVAFCILCTLCETPVDKHKVG